MKAVIEADDLELLLKKLKEEGYTVVGPTRAGGAIVYDELATSADLPRGWTDRQEPASYRLKKSQDARWFGYVVGPQSWKRFLHPPETKLWSAERSKIKPKFNGENGDAPKYALFGVRPCELSAIQVQDKVLLGGPYVDPIYRSRREKAFILAVNCAEPGGTCFCASMGTGPGVKSGYDLAMTEVLEGGKHYFVIDSGTETGKAILDGVPSRKASAPEVRIAETAVTEAAGKMGRALDTAELKEILYRNYDHPRWAEVGERCLTCGNCTMVCPTCFCTTTEDVTDLTGTHAERRRKWDSCFSLEFSYIHGGSVRFSKRSRYRQWMTHKLATWVDQFGSFGCVGCGRCITWCPVGIDITEEARAIRDSEA